MPLKRILKIAVALLLAAAVPFSFAGDFLTVGGLSASRVFAGPGKINFNETDCAYICAELNLLRGEGAGVTDEYLAKTTQRIQAAYLTLRLVGKEAEAERYTGRDNFNDVGHIYEGGQRRTAYLRSRSAQYGWEGDGTNRLMPDDPVTAQQFYKVLLTVLGYQANLDYPYEDTLAFAERETGMKQCRYVNGALINDDIAIMLVEALISYIRDETYTLAEFLAEEGVIDYDKAVELGIIARKDIIEEVPPVEEKPPVTLPTTLTAQTISADNFAEIDIVFNQPIDKNSVDRNYIKIDGGPLLSGDSVQVLDDGITLRIYRENGFVTQQGQRIKVSVSKVKSQTGALEMGAVMDREIAIYDSQPPTLLEVEAIGLRRVKLVFSEPLRTSDSAVRNYVTYKFNGRVYPTSDAIICNGREVYINFSSSLESGQNKLSIDTNRLYDLAGFPIYDVVDYVFTAAEDKDPPYVVSVDAWREKITVEFSEEVRDQVRLYWLDGNVRRVSLTGVKDPYNRNVVTFAFAEGQYLPINTIDIVIESITDMNGNVGTDYRASVSPKFDTDRPVVVSIDSPGTNEIIVGFSKPVRLGTSNNGRFTLRNSNNNSVSVNVQSYTPTGASSPDQSYIRLTGSIPAGSYTLTVVNVEDTTAQANKSTESVHTLNVADKTPPQVLSVSANIAGSRVVIVFNKQLDWNSATEPANYQYFIPGRGHMEVPSGTTAFLEGDGMTVVLTFPSGGWAVSGNQVIQNAFTLYVATNGTDELRVLNVKDMYDNAMDPTLLDVPGTNEVAAKLLPAVYAISPQRLMMRFESTGSLPINAASQDFIVRAGSYNLSYKNMSYNSINNSLRELYIDFEIFDLNPDGTYGTSYTPVTVAMVAPNQVTLTKTALGTPLEFQTGATIQVTDNIKPGLYEAYRGNRSAGAAPGMSGITYPALTRDQILVVFDELIEFQGVSNASQLVNLLDVRIESQPNNSLSPSQYTVEAYDEQSKTTSITSGAVTRMIVVSFVNPINEAVNVSVRANSLWDGNLDAWGYNVMNNAFETGFLGPIN